MTPTPTPTVEAESREPGYYWTGFEGEQELALLKADGTWRALSDREKTESDVGLVGRFAVSATPSQTTGGVETDWALVPREITLEMQHAYFEVVDTNLARVSTDCAFGRYDSQKQAYRAMIAAAPPPAAVLSPAPAGEPVAWRRRPKDSDRSWTLFDEAEDVAFYRQQGSRYDVQPLYASPLPIAGPTKEEVMEAVLQLIDKFPMIDASSGQIRQIRAGWIADAILARIGGR